MTKPITSWSFSRWNLYQECPRKFKYKNIDKLPEPPSSAMDRGSQIHAYADSFVKGVTPLAAELSPVKATMQGLQERYVADSTTVSLEDTWAFRRDWTRTAWDDWNECWLRIKLDVAVFDIVDDDTNQGEVTVIDYKTGKFNPMKVSEYMLQLDLYALGAMLVYGDVTVYPELIYTDLNVRYPKDPIAYTYKQLPKLKRDWEARVAPMMVDTTFEPKPSQSACKFCHFKKSNGGPCNHG